MPFEDPTPGQMDAEELENKGVTLGAGARLSVRLVARLSVYRRMLRGLENQGKRQVFSHELGALAGGTAAQIRRDLMTIGVTGSPAKGYAVASLIRQIGAALDAPSGQTAALVGVGSLGRALLGYFATRKTGLSIAAAFDIDPEKVHRVVHGCRTYPLDELGSVVRQEAITVGILCVPASVALEVADQLVQAGVTGLLNFAPVPLKSSPRAFVEDIDFTTAMEKVAYFARQRSQA